MKSTKADSLAVDSTAWRTRSHVSRRLSAPKISAPLAPMAPPSVGVATPTEGGAMGASGALILGALKRRLTWDLVRQAVESTAKLSAFVVFILIGARVFSLTFYGVSGHIWVEN